MQTSQHPKETIQEALRLLEAHRGNVSKVSRQMGIARSVITSWRDGTRRGTDTAVVPATGVIPAAPAVSQGLTVTRSERLAGKWDRSTNKSLDIVNKRLDQLYVKLGKGGTVTTEDVRGLKEAAWVAGVGTDKVVVLSGGATARTEHHFKVSLGEADPLYGKTFVDRPETIEGEWIELGDGTQVNGEYAHVPPGLDKPGSLVIGNPLLRLAAHVITGKADETDSPQTGPEPAA